MTQAQRNARLDAEMTEPTILRRDHDATLSVYAGEHWCGMVFCPCLGGRIDYLASPWTDTISQQVFATETDAIGYLVREA